MIIPEVFIFGTELNPPNKSIATIRKIRKKFPGTDIIVYDGKTRVSKLATDQYIKVGVSAYLSKSAPVDQLIEYILSKFGVRSIRRLTEMMKWSPDWHDGLGLRTE